MTLYLGAGGGGDTNAAIMCALADTSISKKFVLGAGYSLEEYSQAFIKEQKNRKTQQVDRKAVSNPELVKNYLNESLKNFNSNELSNTDINVWRLDDTNKEAMKSLFDDVKPEDVKYDDPDLQKRHTSYKYQGLLEERLLLRKLNEYIGDNDVLKNIYMFYTTSDWKNIAAINNSYKALKEFVKNKTVNKIVLMDFGGDLIYFSKNGRDPIVLLNCLRLFKDPEISDLTVEVWIYGPGVDSHALPEQVESNLDKFKDITNTVTVEPVNISPLVEFIKTNSVLLKQIDIIGLNRATGNWYEAYNNCIENITGGTRRKNKKQCGGVSVEEYINIGLKTRTEYTGLKTEDEKSFMSEGWERFFNTPGLENTWCRLAKTYKFTLNKSLNDNGKFWPHIQSIQAMFPLTIDGGDKNKSQNYKKTNDKIKVGKREAVIYKGQRGGKYIKQKGLYINIKKLKIA